MSFVSIFLFLCCLADIVVDEMPMLDFFDEFRGFWELLGPWPVGLMGYVFFLHFLSTQTICLLIYCFSIVFLSFYIQSCMHVCICTV